jgi:glycine betaine/choline ABC-type transport system substrate-binding protein
MTARSTVLGVAALAARLAGCARAGKQAALGAGSCRWSAERRSPAASRDYSKVAAAAVVALGSLVAACKRSGNQVVIGSKNFTEQIILGELLAQQIEAHTDLIVRRRLNLGGTLVCHRALVNDEIHAYVEYTGTALTTVLKQPPSTNSRAVFETVRKAYRERLNLDWLAPLGFNNSFAILVRRDDAARLGMRTISDLSRHAPRLRAAFGYEFLERPDGFFGLANAYGLRFPKSPDVMDLALTYHALAQKTVDVIAGDATNGLIEMLGLVMLVDDKQFFPTYDAAPVVSRRLSERAPAFREALAGLAGAVTQEEMRRLNYEVDGRRRDPATVVKEFRTRKSL